MCHCVFLRSNGQEGSVATMLNLKLWLGMKGGLVSRRKRGVHNGYGTGALAQFRQVGHEPLTVIQSLPACSPLFYRSMSLCPGFIESRVLCVCNFYATFCKFVATCFATFCNCLATVLQLFCNFFQVAKSCKTSCKKSCKKWQNNCKTVAKTVANSCKKLYKSCHTVATKLPKKLHQSCKHIEPGKQRTRDTMNLGLNEPGTQ